MSGTAVDRVVGLRHAAIAGLAAVVLVAASRIVWALAAILVAGAAAGAGTEPATFPELYRAGNVLLATALAGGVAATGACFIAWQGAMTRRLPALGARDLDPRTAFGCWSWVLPGVGQVVPLRAVLQIARHAVLSRPRAVAIAIGGWWIAWLGALALEPLGIAAVLVADSARGTVGALALAGVADSLVVAAGGIAIRIVHVLTRDLRSRLAAAGTGT